ncbi:MAG: ferrous iron transporter B, partial [Gammaproteobacteria bacterium]
EGIQFDGRIGAFAYLLFILLYAPCVAATAAIYKETSGGWALFVVCWTTFVAYSTATLFYQSMTFIKHPTSAGVWTAVVLFSAVAVVYLLRIFGARRHSGAVL